MATRYEIYISVAPPNDYNEVIFELATANDPELITFGKEEDILPSLFLVLVSFFKPKIGFVPRHITLANGDHISSWKNLPVGTHEIFIS